jgi:hypothetical protein
MDNNGNLGQPPMMQQQTSIPTINPTDSIGVPQFCRNQAASMGFMKGTSKFDRAFNSCKVTESNRRLSLGIPMGGKRRKRTKRMRKSMRKGKRGGKKTKSSRR